MICTHCFADDGLDQDFTGLSADMAYRLCGDWRCPACLDLLDAQEADADGQRTTAREGGHD